MGKIEPVLRTPCEDCPCYREEQYYNDGPECGLGYTIGEGWKAGQYNAETPSSDDCLLKEIRHGAEVYVKPEKIYMTHDAIHRVCDNCSAANTTDANLYKCVDCGKGICYYCKIGASCRACHVKKYCNCASCSASMVERDKVGKCIKCSGAVCNHCAFGDKPDYTCIDCYGGKNA